jgi:hypothetical protein
MASILWFAGCASIAGIGEFEDQPAVSAGAGGSGASAGTQGTSTDGGEEADGGMPSGGTPAGSGNDCTDASQ